MYLEHFQLREEPFSITPDPAFVFMSQRHREALGHLLYGTGRQGGFVQLTGEVGTGKTTIVRTLLARGLDDVDVAVILNPVRDEREFLAAICDELGVEYPAGASFKELVDALNARLLDTHRKGRRTVLIIDEAQNLTRDVLETVRMLTNLETHKDKLLRIMLVGQPELAELLARDDLRQVAQRITARYHLTALSADETRQYIAHRLRCAGGNPNLFEPAAIRRIHTASRGIPRLINVICDRALLGAYAAGEPTVSRAIAERAIDEVLGKGPAGRRLPAWLLPAGLAAAIALATVVLWPRAVPQPAVVAGDAPAVASGSGAGPVAAGTAATPVEPAAEATPLARLLVALAARWGVQATPDAGFCERISQQGLRCYRVRADVPLLRALNRPAVLELRDAPGGYLLLTAIRGELLALQDADGAVRELSANTLPGYTGDALLLWRPERPESLIGPGASPEAVRWLRDKLNRIAGTIVVDPDAPQWDARLAAQVAAFQRSRGLDADALVGTQTMIALNDADPSFDGPRLSTGAGR